MDEELVPLVAGAGLLATLFLSCCSVQWFACLKPRGTAGHTSALFVVLRWSVKYIKYYLHTGRQKIQECIHIIKD